MDLCAGDYCGHPGGGPPLCVSGCTQDKTSSSLHPEHAGKSLKALAMTSSPLHREDDGVDTTSPIRSAHRSETRDYQETRD